MVVFGECVFFRKLVSFNDPVTAQISSSYSPDVYRIIILPPKVQSNTIDDYFIHSFTSSFILINTALPPVAVTLILTVFSQTSKFSG